jgi:hypothetical protein
MAIINEDNLEEFKNHIINGKTIPELCEIYSCKRTTITAAKKKYGLIGLSPNSKKADRESYSKKCTICSEVKPLSEFWRNGYTPSNEVKYKPFCKECGNRAKNNHKLYYIQEYLHSVNRKYSCEICGYDKNYAALEFHHKNPNDKVYTISSISSSMSKEKCWEILSVEVPKCIILCANCHREWHNPLSNSYKD